MQSEAQLPVFVFPHKLEFDMEDTASPKRILTLYNPYDFSVKFAILSNVPKNYEIMNAEGVLMPQHRADIVIRRKRMDGVTADTPQISEKFRVQLSDTVTKRVIGKQMIESVLNGRSQHASSDLGENDTFESITERRTSHSRQKRVALQYPLNGSTIVVVSCIFLSLWLPEEKEESTLGYYFYLSTGVKLLYTFILGMVISTLFRIN